MKPMQKRNGVLIYSPSDLSQFFRSPYVSWIKRYNVERPGAQIAREPDAARDLLSRKGDEFERQELARLKQEGTVVEIGRGETAFAETIKAMRAGADVIFQAALRKENFEGYADFLRKTPGHSSLGAYTYEVYDTKLARSAKPEYALQLLCYGEMLTELLGHWPARWHVTLGSGETVSFPTADFRHYYLRFKARFLEAQARFDADRPPAPETWEDVSGFDERVEAHFRAQDHLSLVAGITRAQITKLNAAGVTTRAQLATTKRAPQTMNAETFENLRAQAALQLRSKIVPAIEILKHAEGEHRGLARLPEADPGDVMFDMEGDPFAEGGHEYLFGAYFREGGSWTYRAWSAPEPALEKRAFEDFIDWVTERRRAHPGLRVYHYANYEVAALNKLAEKHGTRLFELDALVIDRVFVDLYKVVREGVRAGVESYSIKKLEPIYGFARSADVKNAGDSVVQFHKFQDLRAGDAEAREAAERIYQDIVKYNEEDVVSTERLLAWLRGLAKDVAHVPPPAAKGASEKDWDVLQREMIDSPPGWLRDEHDQRVNAVVAGLAGYFNREDRPVYRSYYDREDAIEDDLFRDAECLTGYVRSHGGRELEIEFAPEQPLKLRVGAKVCRRGTGDLKLCGTLKRLDAAAGRATLEVSGTFERGEWVAFYPGGPVYTNAQSEFLVETARAWCTLGERALPTPMRDLLYRRPPTVKSGRAGQPLYDDQTTPLDAAVAIARDLDGSVLAIQGPPGSGKTYTGAHVIGELLRAGKRVAVVAQGKRTIEHLLAKVYEQWGEGCPPILMADNDKPEEKLPGLTYKTNKDARNHGRYKLVGGTHWVFAHSDFRPECFDYLVIDEAGQFSLAAALVCARVARNLILLGDQMQLEQVNVGKHPEGCADSVLTYYMDGASVIPREKGVFLAETYRMHPGICDLVSELVYEGRLTAHARTHAHVLSGGAHTSGVVFIEVEHEGNSTHSPEEARAIADLVSRLTACSVPDGPRPFSGDARDLIVITPYNAQVEEIRKFLPQVKVGSVDRFQGQEAWVSVLSMCASGAEGLQRGLDFLLSRNRLNVGLSRGKALSVVVGSPRLLEIRPTSLKTMSLLNFYAALMR